MTKMKIRKEIIIIQSKTYNIGGVTRQMKIQSVCTK